MPASPELIAARKAAGETPPSQVCRTCETRKPAAEFRKNYRRESCLDFDCHDCVSDRNRLTRFGITPDEFREMLIRQNGVCAICGRPERPVDPRNGRIKSLAVDHDHESGAVRGLLCQNCNKGIGNLGDDADILISAAMYLVAARGGE